MTPSSSSAVAFQCLGNVYHYQASHHRALLLNLLLWSEDFSTGFYRKAPVGVFQSCPK